jgi:hypothetical protein
MVNIEWRANELTYTTAKKTRFENTVALQICWIQLSLVSRMNARKLLFHLCLCLDQSAQPARFLAQTRVDKIWLRGRPKNASMIPLSGGMGRELPGVRL